MGTSQTARVSLTSYRITDDCRGCGVCRKKCPWDAILGEKKGKHVIEPTICQECGTCWHVCPKRAIEDADGLRREAPGKGQVPKAHIDKESCVGCQNCLLNCEQGAIEYRSGLLAGHCEVDQSKCIGCGSCLAYCAGDGLTLGEEG